MFRTPGLYRRPSRPQRAVGPLSRGDVPVLLGYARRGPVGVAVRVDSVATFEDIFGAPLVHGHLWPAVKGFFETGGRAAYVLRVATTAESARLSDRTEERAAATTASVMVQRPKDEDGELPAAASRDDGAGWPVSASFPWSLFDPGRLLGGEAAASATWAAVVEEQIRKHGPRSPDPGTWANELSISIEPQPVLLTTGRVRTLVQTERPELGLDSTAGLELDSLLRVDAASGPRGDSDHPAVRGVMRLDHSKGAVTLEGRLPADIEPDAKLSITSVEYRVEVRRAGRVEQRFDHLAPHPDHPRALTSTLRRECRSLSVELPEAWHGTGPLPYPGDYQLRGGRDGLVEVGAAAYLEALEPVSSLGDAALVAAPDLVLKPPRPEVPQPGPQLGGPDCAVPDPPARGQLTISVADLDGHAIADAQVVVAGHATKPTTEAGEAEFHDVDARLTAIRVMHPDYARHEEQVQVGSVGTAVSVVLDRVVVPRELMLDEILEVARAMAEPKVVGPYKTAVIDPPEPSMQAEGLRAFAARLGSSSRMALFAPWLGVPTHDRTAAGELRPCPPSGHVCGAISAAEQQGGIERPGANLPLSHVEALTLAIDDDVQAQLNPDGINAIRALPGRGIRVFGDRTRSTAREWRFLSTRRIVDAIEKSLERQLAWFVFEGNSLINRHAVTVTTSAFLASVWRAGALVGESPEAAFYVRSGDEADHPAQAEAGRLIIEVGIAPTQPFEFVVFRLGRSQDALVVTEQG